MKKILIFETNGKRFDSYNDAVQYEKLCKKINSIMKQMLPRTKEIENGTDFNKHNKDTLNGCFKAFCKECAKQIPSYAKWFEEVRNGDRLISHMDRILSDYSSSYPILYDTYYRFQCIDFIHGYEFNQPYYVTHQEEFFSALNDEL